MKLTIRMRKAILQSFILNCIIFLVFAATIIFYVFPKNSEFSAIKEELSSVKEIYALTENTGIDFSDFTSLSTDAQNENVYLKTVLESATPEFYNANIINTEKENFELHLQDLQQEVAEKKSSVSYIERQKSLEQTLPIYSKGDTDGLTEVDFVNYVERILYSFNLSKDGDIGIGDLVVYGEEDTNPNQQTLDENGLPIAKKVQSLDEKIYYIPLNFDITGQKKDVFEFLHYFENVGSISYLDNMIVPYSDNEIGFTLTGDENSSNIYAGQIADIESVELSKYPDSANYANLTLNQNLIEVINSDQAKEEYSITVALRFFVSGIPTYSMEKFISTTLEEFKLLQTSVTNEFRQSQALESSLVAGKQIQALDTLRGLNSYITSLQKEVTDFGIEFAKKENIPLSYETAIELSRKLQIINIQLNNALKDIK